MGGLCGRALGTSFTVCTHFALTIPTRATHTNKKHKTKAVNVARARVGGADGASDDPRLSASDLGLVSIAVDGCPGSGGAPASSLPAPAAAAVRSYDWTLKASARPAAVVMRPRPGQGKSVFSLRVRVSFFGSASGPRAGPRWGMHDARCTNNEQLAANHTPHSRAHPTHALACHTTTTKLTQHKATRRSAGETYELTGDVVVRNPGPSAWRLDGVDVEAVRPGDAQPVVRQAAR